MKWAYGVTTVPERIGDLLPRTLRSLAAGGFDTPRLFVDGTDSRNMVKEFGLDATLHWPRVLCAANWSLAMAELVHRHPDAARYAIFQDDCVTMRNLRRYLESCRFPERGYLNLYTFRDNEEVIKNQPHGWYEAKVLGGAEQAAPYYWQGGKGAVGLVFDRAGALALLASDHFWQKAFCGDRRGRQIDGTIVTAMNKVQFREYVHNPSLLQHLGEKSTVRMGANDNGVPHAQAWSFPGEGWDALELSAAK